MTRDEEIITACKGFLSRYPSIDQAGLSIGFLDGAVWADKHPKNVWHDASEKPEDDCKPILCQDKYGAWFFALKHDIVVMLEINWDAFAAENISRWAYIDDLLPKGGEK